MPFHLGGHGGHGRGGSMKWIIAAILAIVGIVTFLNKGQINPTTGEKQYVALTVDQEKALGLNAAPQLAQQMGGAVDPARDPAARMVKEVGSKLVKATEAFKSPYRDTFEFHLLNDAKTV